MNIRPIHGKYPLQFIPLNIASIFRRSSSSTMSEEHLMGLSMYVYVTSFPQQKATCMTKSHCCATMGPEAPLLEHVQQWEGHCWNTCCTTMASDHISARMTYMIWHEGHLWNVNVLQRVHLSSLVITNKIS
jgi:hypothetical protein